MSKVLILNGSPHVHGCTERALQEAATTLQQEGIETTIINVGNKNIRGCLACYQCKEKGQCVINDAVNDIAPLFEHADGLLIGTPVYYGHANGGLLALLDRLFFSTHFSKVMKVGAAVVSSRRAGSTSAFEDINKYFTISGMPIASSTYWNEVHGTTAEDVEKDIEGLNTMRNLAKAMAFLIKSIEMGKQQIGLPELKADVKTNFIRIEN